MQRRVQAVNVTISLVGPQDIAVTAHRPGTDGAAVSVRVGRALMYLHDPVTVTAAARAWAGLRHSARQLPRVADPTLLLATRGMADPAVMIDAVDPPPMVARMDGPPGQPSRLRVRFGRVLFDVRDIDAFRSTLIAFRRAEHLAATTFLPRPAATARQRAAHAAGRAFAAPTATARRTAARRSRPAAAAAPAAAVARRDDLSRRASG